MLPEFDPSISRPLKYTLSLAPALTTMAAPLVARIPATAPSLKIETALLMVIGP
jgi:hypothetical protein